MFSNGESLVFHNHRHLLFEVHSHFIWGQLPLVALKTSMFSRLSVCLHVFRIPLEYIFLKLKSIIDFLYLKIYSYYTSINASYIFPLFNEIFMTSFRIIIACCYHMPTNIYTNYVMSHNCTNT